jgi:hypothetical protein
MILVVAVGLRMAELEEWCINRTLLLLLLLLMYL